MSCELCIVGAILGLTVIGPSVLFPVVEDRLAQRGCDALPASPFNMMEVAHHNKLPTHVSLPKAESLSESYITMSLNINPKQGKVPPKSMAASRTLRTSASKSRSSATWAS